MEAGEHGGEKIGTKSSKTSAESLRKLLSKSIDVLPKILEKPEKLGISSRTTTKCSRISKGILTL